ncbi:MAG: hypothetical protein ABR583_12070 [Gaiellaceae bacterium]
MTYAVRALTTAAVGLAQRHNARLPGLALGTMMLFAAVVIYRSGSGTTFYFDEWGWFLDRRPWREDIFLEPYNGHLSVFPIVVYKLLFATVGLEDYGVYRALLIAVHLACAGLVFVLVRRRVGKLLALAGVVPLLFLGAAWHDLLVAFQITFLISIAAGLGAWLALESGGWFAGMLAAVLLVLSLGSSTLGIVFAVALLVELVARRPLARLWVGAVPLALYGAWYLDRRDSPQGSTAANGSLSELIPATLPVTPAFAAEAAGGTLSGLLGLGAEWNRPLFAATAVVLVWRLLRTTVVSPRLVSLLAAAFTYWVMLGVFRAGKYAPTESRYLYLGAVLVVLIAAELAAGVTVGRRGFVVVALVAVAAAVGNVQGLRQGTFALQSWSGAVGARFGALELAGRTPDPSWSPDPERLPYVRADTYFQAVRELGSPALAANEIATRPEPDRQAADATLVQALGISGRPGGVPGTPTPRIEGLYGGRLEIQKPCLVVRPLAGAVATVDAAVPRTGVLVESRGAPIDYHLRSFAAGFSPAPLGTVKSGQRESLLVPARPGVAWHARIVSSGRVALCGLRTSP